jgi:hypothetical protein
VKKKILSSEKYKIQVTELCQKWRCNFKPVNMDSINNLTIGDRVWTIRGYNQHGQYDGPIIDIPPNLGGTVSDIENPYSTMCIQLFVIKWDNNQISRHYSKELFSIGPFQNLDEFDASFRNGVNGKLVLGPLGGFREFSINIFFNKKEFLFHLYKEDGYAWHIISDILKKYLISYNIEELPSK